MKSGVHLDSSAYTANQKLAAQYGGVSRNPGIVVIDLPPARTVASPEVSTQLRSLDAQVASLAPGYRELCYASTGNQTLIGNGGRSTIVKVYPATANGDVSAATLDQLSNAARTAAPGATAHVTGKNALAAGNTTTGNTSVLTELMLIGAGAALVVLAWVFGSLVAFLPLIKAIVSVLTMQLLIYGLSFLMPPSTPFNPAVQYIVALLGLGLSIDYSLQIVNRWREEHAAGKSDDDAVRAAMKRAGHAVMFSGLTASLGLFALMQDVHAQGHDVAVAARALVAKGPLGGIPAQDLRDRLAGRARGRHRHLTTATETNRLVARHRLGAQANCPHRPTCAGPPSMTRNRSDWRWQRMDRCPQIPALG